MAAVLFWPAVPVGSRSVPVFERRGQLAQQEGMPVDSTPWEAERLFEEGLQLYGQRTAESLRQAIQKWEEARRLYRAVGDKVREATTLNNMGKVYSDLGEKQKALDYYSKSLPLWQEMRDKAGEAGTLNNIGRVYDDLGEKQKALDYLNQSLLLSREVKDKTGEATAQNNTGMVYSDLGEKQKALYYLNQSLLLRREVRDKAGEATTLNKIGRVYDDLGEKEKALDYFNQALTLSREVNDKAGEAATLTGIGAVYSDLGDKQKALDYLKQSLLLSREMADKAGEAFTLNNIGRVYNNWGEKQKALDYYNQSLPLNQEVGDKVQEARTLTNLAGVEHSRGNLNEALNLIKPAVEIIENLRTKIGSSQLRASYFATQQDTFGLYIDILMALHKQNPNPGYDIAAFEVLERARARSLLELLNEARADIRQGVNPEIREEQRKLQQLLIGKTQYQDRLPKGEYTEAQAETIRQEIAELETQLQQVEAQIRATSPRYAALTKPEPLTLKEVQQQIVDADSILLSYWLGEERSYLWAVTPTSITAYELPKRADIETAAQEFIDYLAPAKNGSADAPVKAATLSKIILAPVAEQLQQKRLLIVADGGLQYVPFSALPVPVPPAAGDSPQLLIAEHEIVSLPSASTLSIIRRDTANRQPAPKAVAVLADPVFGAEDPRVKGTPTPQTPAPNTPNLTRGTDSEGKTWARLAGTRQEANRILSLVPDSEKMQAFDFDANLDKATDSVLSNYRVVHFATHGFLNSQNPQLSGIVLSLVKQFGVPQNGYLLTPAVFNLNLPAELVVLSGCETGKGKEVKGEGIVGLTRGFMYAGAKRVMVSLWSVSDQQGTPELMGRFYEKMLKEGLPPARALREAQLSMMREGKEPYYWAPFILQGEWK
jgi:CHAT domain-containing protein